MDLAEMKLVAENSRTLYEMRDALNCAIEQLSIVEGELLARENSRQASIIKAEAYQTRAEKAERERDTWLSAHDAIYAELQEVKRRCAIAETVLKQGPAGLWELADYRERNCLLESALREVKQQKDRHKETAQAAENWMKRAEKAEQERDRYREALGKLAASYKPFNMSITSLMGKIAADALTPTSATEE